MRFLRSNGLCNLSLCLIFSLPFIVSGCSSKTDERLEALENQMIAQQVVELRVGQLEERMTLVEEELGAVKEAASAAKAPARAAPRPAKSPATPLGPRAIDPDAPATPLPGKPAMPPASRAGSGRPAENSATQPATPGPVAPAGPQTPAAGPSANGTGSPNMTPAPQTQPPAAASPVADESAGAVRRTASGSEKAAYDAALSLYNRRKFNEAAKDFSAFLANYPQSPLTPNARYWMGECHYSLKQYDQAIMAFKDVAGKYPKHDKAAASLLKLGYSYANMGDSGNARFYLQMLLDDFPGSGPAKLGQKRLQSLK